MIDYIPLTLGRYTRQVRIYEVKSSRADFLADSKWESYLRFCTQFAFVAPAGAIQRWELHRDVGLIECEWLALLETMAFAHPLACDEPTFTDGAGI